MTTNSFDLKGAGASGDSSIHDYIPIRRDPRDNSTLDLPHVIQTNGFNIGLNQSDAHYYKDKSFAVNQSNNRISDNSQHIDSFAL